MSKAEPIVKAYLEESERHPEGGSALSTAFRSRVEEIKQKSVVEKKSGSLLYRDNLVWAGISTQEDFDKRRTQAIEEYRNGSFFMERIGRYREVDGSLTLVMVELRKLWIEEYAIQTVPEFMLLDMAMTAYFHFIRLNGAINDIMAGIEWECFALDVPQFKMGGNESGRKAIAEELAHKLKEVLQPALEQYNYSFLRNLKSLKDLRRGSVSLNIANVGQMNVAERQVNLETKG